MRKSEPCFRRYVEANSEQRGECLVWTRVVRTEWNPYIKTTVFIHRWVYEEFVGPIPEGMDIDHMCHNTWCISTEHLRPLTHKHNSENRKGVYSNSLTGARGVTRARNGDYQVRVTHHYKTHCFGTYKTLEEASGVAKVIRQQLHLYSAN